jgi:hypothetical protein
MTKKSEEEMKEQLRIYEARIKFSQGCNEKLTLELANMKSLSDQRQSNLLEFQTKFQELQFVLRSA